MANPNIVSVSSIYGESVAFHLTTTLTTPLITVSPNKLLKLNSIVCANVDGTNDAQLNLYIAGVGTTVTGVTGASLATTIYLAKTVNVPADDILVVVDKPIYLMEGDVLTGGASAASDLDLFMSFEVINDA